jgi:hypothetical protein
MTAPLYNEHYLNVLNSVYYDNIRQIERLSQTNQEIRQILISAQRGTRNNRSNRNHSHNNVNNTNNTNNVNNVNNRNYSRNYAYSRNNSQNHGSSNAARTYINNVEEYAHRLPMYFFDASHNIQRNTEFMPRPTRNNTFDTLLNAFLEPVPTYPGALQVEIATRNVRYGDIVSPMNTSCPISLEIFTDNDIVTIICYCGHIFMATEIHNWFSSNCRCPVCRYDIREYRSTNVINHALDISANITPSITPSITQTTVRNTDFSGNLIDSITDTLLNELLNSSTFSSDASSNLMENTLATFYFAFPRRERR